MAETLRLVLGTKVTCTDGEGGLVHALVVDPRTRHVTHLVAEPEHRIGLGQLVPLGLVSSTEADEGDEGEVQLDCDLATFDQLPHAESTDFLHGLGDDYAIVGRIASPVQADVHDVLPAGEVATHEGDTVSATDGPIGVVAGFVADASTHAIIELLISEERLLWGHKVISVPISAVTNLHPDVQLSLATAEVGR
jgi:hypothetical protein